MTNVTIFDLIPQPLAFKSALRLLEYHRLPQEGQVPLLESGLAPNPERRHSHRSRFLLGAKQNPLGGSGLLGIFLTTDAN
jgi:hypothetical protein